MMAEEIFELAEETSPADLNGLNLIKDGPNEILGKTLQSFRVNNKTAKQKERLDEVERQFVRAFVCLCWKLPDIGISPEQISEILSRGEEYVILLNNHVDKKTRFLAMVQKIICYGSVVGALFVFMIRSLSEERPTDSWTHQDSRKILENAYGKGYFPMETLRKYLQKS